MTKKGRPHGTTKGRVKLGITVSAANYKWLDDRMKKGHGKSATIDMALDLLRETIA